MRITRRNTLAVLLVIVAAGGIVGTGAFSQVSADRTVDVNTAGDSSANVQFVVNTAKHGSLTDDGGDTVELEFDNVNVDAVTTYEDALNITFNTNADGDYQIEATSVPTDMEIEFADGTTTQTNSTGEMAQADIILNTTGETSISDANTEGDITFTVTRQ